MNFEPFVVIQCPTESPEERVSWLMGLITRQRSDNGAELLAFRIRRKSSTALHTILVGGDAMRLIQGGDLIGLKKEFSDGTMREYSADNIAGFVNADDLEMFLTGSEKQKVIQHELNQLRYHEGMTQPRFKFRFYNDELIIPKLTEEGEIVKFFPLHDVGELANLRDRWCKSLLSFQPLDRIQQYFGEKVAMYAAFLGTYTLFLVPPAILGVLTLFNKSPLLIPSLCALNMVWTTVFLEWWKRTGTELAYFWGTYNMEMIEEPRPQYYGELKLNPFNQRLEKEYSRLKAFLRLYCVSVPIIIIFLLTALGLFWASLAVDDYVHGLAAKNKRESLKAVYDILCMLPKIVYGILLSLLNKVYAVAAKSLTDFENHRLESQYENHLSAKLMVFIFVNSFVSLFYIAFYLRDFEMLTSQLAALLITQQVINNFQELILPYLLLGYRKKQLYRDATIFRSSTTTNYIKEQVALESAMDEYPGPFADYIELWVQFGYVYLFSAVFPLAAFCALINNIYEVRTDAFKLCKVHQRAFCQSVSGIGVFQIEFEVMSVISVMTNCTLVALSDPVKEYLKQYDIITYIFIFVLAEHLIIAAKVGLAYLIPDKTYFVERALMAAEFEEQQYLRDRIWANKTHRSSR